MSRRSIILRGIISLFCLIFAGTAAMAAPQVSAVRIGENPDSTRFVIDMTEAAEYQVFTLADPYRLVIDFERLEWQVNDRSIRPEGLISEVRYGRFTADTSRVVLDLAGPAEPAQIFTLPRQGNYPHRFVIDLKPTSRSTFLAGINQPDRSPAFRMRTREAPQIPQPARGKRVVVVDAGHGGIDPGTLGVYGPDEKHVTLEVAREVKRQLESTGRYSVVLTRDKDILHPLRRRIDISRAADADLFISLHADSISNRKVRGATVYTLSETASDSEAAALAKKENRSDIIAGVNLSGESDDVTSILIDLAQRETMNYSAEFAEILVPHLGQVMTLRTNSHRFAGFVVLKAPDVPSVLVEMGFLSNEYDARFMYSKDGQRKIASAIVRATDAYFSRFES